MKIVVATPLYPPDIGGPATYAKLLKDGMPQKGVEIILVAFTDVRHLPKGIRHIAYYRRVLKAAWGADAVLALDPVSVGLPALWAARRAKKPFVVKIVGDYAWEQGCQRCGVSANLDEFVTLRDVPLLVRVLRYVQRRVAEGAARIIVPSDYLKRIVKTWGAIEDERFAVIPNVVSLEEMGTVPEAVTALPRPWVVTAGRLVPWKHIDGVIDALAESTASFVVVGDGPLRSVLEERAREKLSGRFVFTGTLSHADTLATIKSADVFVLNSSYEGLSHLLIEALALGTPIVATQVGGNPEVITDRTDGILVPVGDTQALSTTLTQLLGNVALRAHLRTHALESAQRFSVGSMIDATVSVFAAL